MESAGPSHGGQGGLRDMPPVPVVAVRAGLPAYAGLDIGWPPGWAGLWRGVHVLPTPRIDLTGGVLPVSS
jgi:hypothetical protein